MRTPPLACETARRHHVLVNGLRLHCLESGRPGAPALLMLHGGAAHAHWFDRVTPGLAGRFRVVALDQRGHGESEWARPPAYGTAQFTADLHGLIDALGLGRPVLVGHSMGGHNAMTFAAWYPDRLAGLVVVDSRPAIPEERLQQMHDRPSRPLKRHASRAAAAERFRLLPPQTTAEPALLRHLALAGLMEQDGAWVYRFDPATYGARDPVDAWPLLGRIEAPTLLVRGEGSPVMPADLAERMRAAIPGSRLVTVPGTYHHLVLDRPEAFVEALGPFLEKLAL